MRRKVYNVAHRGWFPVLLFLLLLIPPYASKGFELNRVLQLNAFVLTHAIKYRLAPIYPLFNTLAITLIVAVFVLRNRISQTFAIYAALSYILFAVLQNVSITEEHGVAICLSNVALFLVVSASWFYEVKVGENDFGVKGQPKWRWLFFLPALLAIWQPVDPVTMGPDFNPMYLLNSGSGLTFCMMTTVYLSVLLYFFPSVNVFTLRITSLAGLLIGLGNLWLEFLYLHELWWVGVLHLPLVIMSGCGLWLSYRVRTPKQI